MGSGTRCPNRVGLNIPCPMHDFCNCQLNRLDEVENNTFPEDNILVAKEPEAVDV